MYLHGDGVRDRLGFEFIEADPSKGNRQDPLSLHKYLYADADAANMSDPTGYDSEFYTSTNGIAAHILFSAYISTRGFTPHLIGPDATQGSNYYDLKPITHLNGTGLGTYLAQAADASQMAGYRGTWGTPGDAHDIVPDGGPDFIGWIVGDDGTAYQMNLYTQNDPMTPSGLPGTGIVLYELVPDEDPPAALQVPEVVPDPTERPYLLQSQAVLVGAPIAYSYDASTLEGLAALGALGGLAVATGYYGAAALDAGLGIATALGALGG